jgi:glyoxylase-like metal-dependent hydrolase (beta-lactamase superfamily II)
MSAGPVAAPPLAAVEGWFSHETVAPGVIRLTEPFLHPFVRANLWLFSGPDADLLVDTGNGVAALALVVDALRRAERPLLVFATHAHVDHVGGLHEFADRIGHAAEAEGFARVEDADTLAPYLRQTVYEPGAPAAAPAPATVFMRPAPLTRVVKEGDVVDLGGSSRWTVLHLPGHSPGSAALLEERTGTLFAGDAVYEGGLVDDLPHSDVAVYVETMRRLADLDPPLAYAGHGRVLGPGDVARIARAYVAEKGG